MIFDLLTPPEDPRGRGKIKFAVAHPIHVSNSHTKFCGISSKGLGGDSITDRRRRLQYPLRFFLKSVGINIETFVISLTLCVQMEFPINLDTLKSGWSIVYSEGPKNIIFLSLKNNFSLAKSADPD